MAKTAKIKLGDHELTINRLQIGVLRELDAEMADNPPDLKNERQTEEFHFDRAIKCISIALSTIDPMWTVEAVKAIELDDIAEIFVAHRAILFHSGLIKLKDVKSGEEQEAA